jgi:uncharacterized circularly permuted ATP-grasp superfamily protein
MNDYQPKTGYDELLDNQGFIRNYWLHLIESLRGLGAEELSERSDEIRRQLRDNGVTYNVFGDTDDQQRPWLLDAVPLLIPSTDWVGIERGMQQRLELFDLLLKDLYGPAHCLKQGVIPPDLVFSSLNFLRNCTGLDAPDNRLLHLYNGDVARAGDGQYYIMGDRCGSLSGVGYALENRMVLSRVFPSLFRNAQAHRLATFFRNLRQQIYHAAKEQPQHCRIVILSPGPESASYFEHAYIVRYLGYTLVEGADLTVRDACVWLKTLDGLQRVDIIVRWLESYACDPLELKSDAVGGVAGLVQAVRQNNVTVINPLGSEVVNSIALAPFMNAVSQYFLNEPLILPSPESWWCGADSQRDYVIQNMERLLIHEVDNTGHSTVTIGDELSEEERGTLRDKIQANPRAYVGQQRITFSSMPLYDQGRFTSKRFMMRTFAIATEHNYQLMPGGIAILSPKSGGQGMSLIRDGGVSKDIWVLASEPEKEHTLLIGNELGGGLPNIERGDIPSRVIENLFWLGRYVERAESGVRLLRNVLLLLLDHMGEHQDDRFLDSLLRAVTITTETYPGFVGEGAEARLKQPEAELMSIFLDRNRVGSLTFNLKALLTAARSVRDRLSPDIWRVFNRIEESLEKLQTQRQY